MKKKSGPSKMSLKEVLYDIKVNGNAPRVKDLVKTEEVRSLIRQLVTRYGADHKEVFRIWLNHFTIVRYKYEEDFTEERYLHYARKHIGTYLFPDEKFDVLEEDEDE